MDAKQEAQNQPQMAALGDWETLAAGRGNCASPAAVISGPQLRWHAAGRMGSTAGDVAYSAVSMAIIQFEK
jgi:hypothetical protein